MIRPGDFKWLTFNSFISSAETIVQCDESGITLSLADIETTDKLKLREGGHGMLVLSIFIIFNSHAIHTSLLQGYNRPFLLSTRPMLFTPKGQKGIF